MRLARDRRESLTTCLRVAPVRRVPTLAEDFEAGMLRPPRWLPPKYFYDDRGSRLFERICETPEYYPTRTEDALLARFSEPILDEARPLHIIELGAGSAVKTRRLFDACEAVDHRCAYLPFDVCEPMLERLAAELPARYGWLAVTPLLGDYHAGLAHLPLPPGPTLFLFLGSTLGNFTPRECREFLREVRECMRPGDWFLLGVDRIKDPAVLHAAYNDAEGVTASFNLNLLHVLNRRLGANFDPANFRHEARYDEAKGRIEMYLAARHGCDVNVMLLRKTIHLRRDERILTELSHKFPASAIEELLRGSGFEVRRHYQPDNAWFSLLLCRPAAAGFARSGSSM
jgi:L-histidine N-alpha-methyltransferase